MQRPALTTPRVASISFVGRVTSGHCRPRSAMASTRCVRVSTPRPNRRPVASEGDMAEAPFRVALSGDFRKADGTPAYPMFDLAPLAATPGVEYAYVDAVDGLMQAADLAGFDALILLAHRFDE